MDLVQTVRKEGSRGGRTDFKWEDVKNDSQRENYLGHSLMAPVGRWQKGRDLNWYARGDTEEDKQTEAERIKEEKRKVKEAEEDAMLKAMGLPVPDRASNNANLTPLGEKVHEADVEKAVEAKAEEGEGEGEEVEKEKESKHRSRRDRNDRDGERRKRRRSRSRSRDRRDRDRRRDRSRSRDRRRDRDRDHDRHRHRSRERGHDGHRRRSRSRDRDRDRDREDRHHWRSDRKAHDERPRSREGHRRRRSRSPYEDRERRRD